MHPQIFGLLLPLKTPRSELKRLVPNQAVTPALSGQFRLRDTCYVIVHSSYACTAVLRDRGSKSSVNVISMMASVNRRGRGKASMAPLLYQDHNYPVCTAGDTFNQIGIVVKAVDIVLLGLQ